MAVVAVAAREPIDLLLDYERRLEAAGARLPAQEEARDRWSGIGFRVGDDRFVASMDEVREVLDPPACTRVPGTAPWFLGIANVRGTLVPVLDLHGFVTGGRAAQSRQARALMYQRDGVAAAFRVDDVLGMKRFYLEEQGSVGTTADALAPYVSGGFRRLNEQWPVLSLSAFVASRDFLEIAR
jgi:twitching motility protein PilI